jgi:NAD(P)-dependent dehydrogenase (short-subunit alcohol dehydrogenase family)
MDLGLASKVAIVNGGSQGIGYAIARLLAEQSNIHQDQIRLFITGNVERPQTLRAFRHFIAMSR